MNARVSNYVAVGFRLDAKFSKTLAAEVVVGAQLLGGGFARLGFRAVHHDSSQKSMGEPGRICQGAWGFKGIRDGVKRSGKISEDPRLRLLQVSRRMGEYVWGHKRNRVGPNDLRRPARSDDLELARGSLWARG